MKKNKTNCFVVLILCTMFALPSLADDINRDTALLDSNGNYAEEKTSLRIDENFYQDETVRDSLSSFTTKHHRFFANTGICRRPVDSDLYDQYPIEIRSGFSYGLAYEYMPLWPNFPYLAFGLRYYGDRYLADIYGDDPMTCCMNTQTLLPTISIRAENKRGGGFYTFCGFGYGNTTSKSPSASNYSQLLEGHGFVSLFGTGLHILVIGSHSLAFECTSMEYLKKNAPYSPLVQNFTLRYQCRF